MSDHLGEFAARMVANKYAHTKPSGYKESWPEIATRVVQAVVQPYYPQFTSRIQQAIESRELMPGGRYLYAAGRRYQQLNNCLSGDTEVVTSLGILPIKSLVGKSFKVRNRHGRWEDATAQSFGVQRLYKVTFSNREEVLATLDHRWCLPSGGFSTTARVKRVALIEPVLPALDEEGIRHGICFGDGTTQKQALTDKLVLCGPKTALAPYFGQVKVLQAGPTITKLPARYKVLPTQESCSPEYARGFIAGLIATDGSTKTSTVTISCQGEDKARGIAKLAVLGGCVVNGVIRQKSEETNYGKRAEPLFVISIKPMTAPVIRPDQVKELQARRLTLRKMWLQVTSVEDTGRDEEVYCCVVPGSESFSLANGIASGNCFLFRAHDSREGWASLDHDMTASLMTGGGVGVVYTDLRPEGWTVGGMGGQSTGPIALMNIQNEKGRFIRQGGSRRSAIWAGLHWWHPDVLNFIQLKDHPEWMMQKRREDYNFPCPMDGTNISVILDDDFFLAYANPSFQKTFPWGTVTHLDAQNIYWACVRSMLRSGEPGFSVDIGPNTGENLRNAPIHGDTQVLTNQGYQRVCNLVGVPTTVWTGKQWAPDVVFRKTGEMLETVRVTMTGGREIVCDPSHPFLVEFYQGRGKSRHLSSSARIPAGDLEEGDVLSVRYPFPTVQLDKDAYTLGFVYGDGSIHKTGPRSEIGASLTICHETKQPCATYFTQIRSCKPNQYGFCSYTFWPTLTEGIYDKEVVPGSNSPSWVASFIAGLFDADGNAYQDQHRIRLGSVSYSFLQRISRMLETLGIMSHISPGGSSGYTGGQCWQLVIAACSVKRFSSIIPTIRVKLDVSDWEPYRDSHIKVISVQPAGRADVYCADVKVGEHSFMAEGVLVSNCTEVTSRTDGDMCNLASLNLARIRTKDRFEELVELGMVFLLCGTLASRLPVERMYAVRELNRRLGLGLMGIHEWLLVRDARYAPHDELKQWLDVYGRSGQVANHHADIMGISRPIATRSIAPNGTIAMVAETTSSCEPINAVAYKRRYLDGKRWKVSYRVDPTAQRLIDRGVSPHLIEDAFTLAEDVERRVSFQGWVQQYVDHGISSTINLPPWGTPLNCEKVVTQFGTTLLKHLPSLRGITAYPDGARGGQPIVRVTYQEAVTFGEQEFTEESDYDLDHETLESKCKGDVCSS